MEDLLKNILNQEEERFYIQSIGGEGL